MPRRYPHGGVEVRKSGVQVVLPLPAESSTDIRSRQAGLPPDGLVESGDSAIELVEVIIGLAPGGKLRPALRLVVKRFFERRSGARGVAHSLEEQALIGACFNGFRLQAQRLLGVLSCALEFTHSFMDCRPIVIGRKSTRVRLDRFAEVRYYGGSATSHLIRNPAD